MSHWLSFLGCFWVVGLQAGVPNLGQRLQQDLVTETKVLLRQHPGQSAALALERGEISLLTRAWLAEHAQHSLDVQYFIWSADNVGRLAMQALLSAADRGVKVRVQVDDLLLDLPPELLAALDGHPNLEIRVYNPTVSVGVSFWRKYWNVLTRFRTVNQRMHNKALIVDGVLAVVGGRNLADEYFDFDPEFNFRDRDLLLAGPVVAQMQARFEEFWVAPQSRSVGALVPVLPDSAQEALRRSIHQYAVNPENFSPAVRKALKDLPQSFEAVVKEMAWGPATFVIDEPGKNDGRQGLGGGGKTTRFLAEVLRSAHKRVTIQSPYLVPDQATLDLFKELSARGVQIRISTNSQANNDNLQAVSGYLKQRAKVLDAGVQIYEMKPDPAVQKSLSARYGATEGARPVFVVHAKTLVVDGSKVFVGTFNLDPRSMNLNTESGVLLEHPGLAHEIEAAIEKDMAAENSWDVRFENGDSSASWSRRIKVWLWRLLPMQAIL